MKATDDYVDEAIKRVLKKPKTDSEFVSRIQSELAEQAAKRGQKMRCVTKVLKRDANGRIEEIEMTVTNL